MRREHRRKDRGLVRRRFVETSVDFGRIVVGRHTVIIRETMARKTSRSTPPRKAARRPARKTPRRTAQARARQRTRARTRRQSKGPQKRATADKKAAAGAMPQWTAAEIEEAFRRFAGGQAPSRGRAQAHQSVHAPGRGRALAQATDAGVNKATPALFAAADTPEKMAALGEARVQELIKTIGLFRTKAKNVVALSRKLVEEHGSEVRRRARRWRRCLASAARPRMSFSTSPSASRRSRSIPTFFASATGPDWRPARPRSRSR